MKSLLTLGQKYILHERKEGKEKIVFCPCGLKHVTKIQQELYLKCRCGRKVRINDRFI